MGDYPKIMRHNDRGVIVKFTAHRVGTVVGVGQNLDDFEIGYHCTTWMEERFKDYKPVICETGKRDNS